MKASRLLIATAIAAAFPFAGAFAQNPPQPAGDPSPQSSDTQQSPSSSSQPATFESLDTNGDGRISKTEAAANDNVSAQFGMYDKNGDGYIDRSEVNKSNGADGSSSDSSPPRQ